jgi:hypothetical protein
MRKTFLLFAVVILTAAAAMAESNIDRTISVGSLDGRAVSNGVGINGLKTVHMLSVADTAKCQPAKNGLLNCETTKTIMIDNGQVLKCFSRTQRDVRHDDAAIKEDLKCTVVSIK